MKLETRLRGRVPETPQRNLARTGQDVEDSGVYDYSIFWDKETNILFAVQKIEGEQTSQDLEPTPIVQKWWDYMADIMETNPDNSPVSIPLPELFYMA